MICKLHSIAASLDANKLNIDEKDKKDVATTLNAEGCQIIILLKEYLEEDELYGSIAGLVETYSILCSDPVNMVLFERSIQSVRA